MEHKIVLVLHQDSQLEDIVEDNLAESSDILVEQLDIQVGDNQVGADIQVEADNLVVVDIQVELLDIQVGDNLVEVVEMRD